MPSIIETLAHKLTEQLLPVYGDHHTAEHNAWFLLEHITQKNRAALMAHPELHLTPEQENQLETWVKEITLSNKPIQYILGTIPFLDLTIKVRPPTLIPRPETEEWCATLIETLRSFARSNFSIHPSWPDTRNEREIKILDLCTGSGCIALALAHAFPKSTVYASDISAQALELAQENAQLNNISNVTFLQSDLYTALPHQRFDLIVSNPPYITPEEYQNLDPSVAQWEDEKSLVALEHGLKIIHEIIKKAPDFLEKHEQPFPQVWIEMGYRQADSVCSLFEKNNFTPHVLRDLYGNDRVVTGTFKKT